MKEHELSFDNFPTFTTKSTNRRNFFLFLILFFLILTSILVGLFLLGAVKNSSKKNSKVVAPTIIVATESPLPTSSASAVLKVSATSGLSPTSGISAIEKSTNLDRSKLNVVVLNGSGVAGAASALSAYLQGLGYKIVRVDNADVFSYTNLTVLVRKSKSSYTGLLKKDLQANPNFASVSASVSDDITNEAEVIVGK